MQFSLYSSPLVNTPLRWRGPHRCMYNHVPAHVTAPPPLPHPFQLLFQTHGQKKKQTWSRPLRRAKSGRKNERKNSSSADNIWKHCGYSSSTAWARWGRGPAPTRRALWLPLPVGSDQPERFELLSDSGFRCFLLSYLQSTRSPAGKR